MEHPRACNCRLQGGRATLTQVLPFVPPRPVPTTDKQLSPALSPSQRGISPGPSVLPLPPDASPSFSSTTLQCCVTPKAMVEGGSLWWRMGKGSMPGVTLLCVCSFSPSGWMKRAVWGWAVLGMSTHERTSEAAACSHMTSSAEPWHS